VRLLSLHSSAIIVSEKQSSSTTSIAHSHPTQELSENGLPLGKIDSKPDKEGRQISFGEAGFTSKGWHTDVAFENKPALFSILQMVRVLKLFSACACD
jgi:alpha-ketoglutarate-dependent taurine dioxygenase